MEDKQMDVLMKAAKEQLEAQQRAEARKQYREENNIPEMAGEAMEIPNPESQENIYADLINEMDEPEVQQMEHKAPAGIPEIQHGYDVPEEPEYYIDPNDTEAFPGGPGQSQVDIWKKEFKRVFHVQILDRHFIFRALNRFEYKQIVAIENIDQLYREEIFCQVCTLWPINYDFKKMAAEDSGYPSTLASIIMENSGFTKEYGVEIL